MARQHGDRKMFRNEDLVLKVSPDVDRNRWDESKYEAFLDYLCGPGRQFQAESIQTTLRFLLGGRYSNARELARENFESNEKLPERYGSLTGMEHLLLLPEHLSCSLDIATGAGKSYVLYGLATILLAEGVVDRVLVLCPSTTIEAGLMEKFRTLASDSNLEATLPPDARVRIPSIISADETLAEGTICVENYHAILEHVGSSIRDSLRGGKGSRTAVLSDEAHHVANDTAGQVKAWKAFLLDPNFGIRYHVGVSGTCYVGNDYFSDVVSRYSIRQAIEDRIVKRIDYVAEMPAAPTSEEWWQLIYKRHQDLKKKLKPVGIRPLTIVITKNIKDCDRVTEELRDLIEKWGKLSSEEASELVIPVSSSPNHQPYLAKLSAVDEPGSSVEWIVSVAMLTEGWDVKNVFQIVPHSERAFDSKLLISQVLGRGLRVPPQWRGEQPTVTVFNHDSWAPRIRQLVNEILELERRLSSHVVTSSRYNFELHHLDYTQEESRQELTRKLDPNLFERGFVELPTQVDKEEVIIEFEGAVGGRRSKYKTTLEHRTYSDEEVAEHIFNRLLSIDQESEAAEEEFERTSHATEFPYERCLAVVKESLQRAGVTSGRVTEDNRQRFLQALGSLSRRKAERIVYAQRPDALRTLSTGMRQSDSCSAAELRRGSKTVFYGPGAEDALTEEQRIFFQEATDPDGEFAGHCQEVAAAADFKTPLNLAIADATPERKFIRELCGRENAKAIDAWLKNTAQGFYAIDYAWKKGTHTKRGEFSPDFFIKLSKLILVVEIKDDGELADPAPENAKKYEYANRHFERLNEWMARDAMEPYYQVNFLSPKDFNKFFQKLREGAIRGFRSELDLVLAAAAKR